MNMEPMHITPFKQRERSRVFLKAKVSQNKNLSDIILYIEPVLLYRQPSSVGLSSTKTGPFRNKVFLEFLKDFDKTGESSAAQASPSGLKAIECEDQANQRVKELDHIARAYIGHARQKMKHEWSFDYEMALLLKMIGIAYYRDQIEAATRYGKEAEELLDKVCDRVRLEGRLACYMTAIYRDTKDWNLSKDWLVRAQILENMDPCGDTAQRCYNEGKFFMDRLAAHCTMAELRLWQSLAIHFFQTAAQHYIAAPDRDNMRIRRCLLNMASVLVLSPRKQQLREIAVSEQHIKDAQRILKELKEISLQDKEDTDRHKLQVMISMCEVDYRWAMLQSDSHSRHETLHGIIHRLKEITAKSEFKEGKSAKYLLDHIQTILSNESRINISVTQSEEKALIAYKVPSPQIDTDIMTPNTLSSDSDGLYTKEASKSNHAEAASKSILGNDLEESKPLTANSHCYNMKVQSNSSWDSDSFIVCESGTMPLSEDNFKAGSSESGLSTSSFNLNDTLESISSDTF